MVHHTLFFHSFRHQHQAAVAALTLAASLLALPSAARAADFAYRGACDASAAVALDAEHFVAASDEDNTLRIYRRGNAALPVQSFEVGALIRADPRRPESDLEGAARVGDTIYWISSHSRSGNGKDRPGRDRFFGTRFSRAGEKWKLEMVGTVRGDLTHLLASAPGLAALRLAEAAERSPKGADAFNLEGLCATPEGHLLLGFRNPLHTGQAVLVPLRNPAAFVTGAAAEFGPFHALDLGGLGIRDLIPWRQGYLIAAGPAFGGGQHQLWFWPGDAARPQRLKAARLKGFDVEAMIAYHGLTDSVELLSDDSSETVGGVECGKLPAAQRQFRSLTMALPDEWFASPVR